MRSTLKWIYTIPGKKRGYVPALIMIQAVTGGTGVLYALLLRNIVDSAVARDLFSFRQNVIRLAALVLVLLGVGAFVRRLYEQARTDIENLFKKRLTDTLLRKDYAAVTAVHSGEWMTRLTSDTSVVARGYVDLLPGLVGTVVRLICALIMIIALDRWFAYILVPGGIALVILTASFRGILKQLHKEIQESDGRLRSFLQERISSLMVIKAFSAEELTSDGAWEKMHDHKAARMKRNAFANFCSLGFSGAMQGMYLAGVVYCAYGILSGTVTYGTLTAVMQLIGQVQGPFASLSGFVSRLYAMTASAERLMEAEAFSDDCPDPVPDAQKVQSFYQEKFRAIALQNASFSYPAPAYPVPAKEQDAQKEIQQKCDLFGKETMPVVLRNLSLIIRKGEYAAFTGHSGCGKSTVLKLLMCLYPLDDGNLMVIGAGGTIPLTAQWRRLFAYVPQGNALMSGKLRDVVAFARPDYSGDDEGLHRALSIACADEFLPELENGLDTVLGECGSGLSEGQMQRIAIARAVFSGAPILLLDEATSALDEETEKRLLLNLRRLTDKTVIIVTHRKAALSICDRMLAFTEGGVKEVIMPGSKGG